MHIVRAAHHHQMPWKNGGGSTIQVAIAPADATLENFDWRISMARVATPGPFSRFPGVDRTLAVIDGSGIHLTIDGATVTLKGTSPPHVFAGEAETTAALIEGPIHDLNVMSRRAHYRHRLTYYRAGETLTVPRDADTIVIMPRSGDVALEIGGSNIALASGDAAILDRPDVERGEIALRPDGSITAGIYLIVFWRTAALPA